MDNLKIEDIIKDICTRALKGELSIDEFYNLWPYKEANSNSFYQIIFQDLEEGIEHCPGFFYKKGINMQEWTKSNLYRAIFIDVILLDHKNKNEEFLKKYRLNILASSALTYEEIKIRLNEIEAIKEGGHGHTTQSKVYNNMSVAMEIAQNSFKEIASRFPELKMHVHADAPCELCMDISQQEKLAFDVRLSLQNNDELHLTAGHFWCEWFPCTERKRVEQYIDAVSGLLSGKYRIVEHYHGKRVVKAELQVPVNEQWKIIAARATFNLPFPCLKKHCEILQNVRNKTPRS